VNVVVFERYDATLENSMLLTESANELAKMILRVYKNKQADDLSLRKTGEEGED